MYVTLYVGNELCQGNNRIRLFRCVLELNMISAYLLLVVFYICVVYSEDSLLENSNGVQITNLFLPETCTAEARKTKIGDGIILHYTGTWLISKFSLQDYLDH